MKSGKVRVRLAVGVAVFIGGSLAGRRGQATGSTPEIKRLGCPAGAARLQGKGFNELSVLQALKADADARAAGLASTLDALKAEGITCANALAGALSERGYATPRGPMTGPERSQPHGSAV